MKVEVSLSKRIAAIKNLTCFAMLTPNECKQLAKLMKEVSYDTDAMIVQENDLIDSVYIIMSGKVEIRHQSTVKKIRFTRKTKRVTQVPVASLLPGEAIGLNDTGFFSTTGKRTASAIALSKVLALKIDLKDLQDFLKNNPHLLTALQDSSKKILRMRLIKQSLPFSRLSHERIALLAEQVKELKVPSGDVIFSEGEIGDKCFLIYSGKVEIVSDNHQLAVLEPPTLFGEATVITQSPRNATAKALTDCDLLVLDHRYLSELIETENNVNKMLMNLMIDRSRPLQSPHITVHERMTVDRQPIFILKNPKNSQYFKLSKEGWFIWQLMDGEKTMQEITLALAEQHQIFSPNTVASIISKLARAGFIMHVEINQNLAKSSQPAWVRAMLRIRNILESRIALGDVDKLLTYIYKKGGFILFNKFGKIFFSLLILVGVLAFGFVTPKILSNFKTMHDSWILLLFLIPFTLLSVLLHELGHALATKSFGREVHHMGVGWYWLGPVAFTDTSDMWLTTRGPRVMVNLAGIYMDLLVGGISALLIYFFNQAHIQSFLWLFALFTYVSAFRMLNPLQELDGYYVLADVFDRARLRQTAVVWLIKGFPKALRHPKLFKNNLPELYYWAACFIFIILLSLLTYILQTFIFKILEFEPGNLFVSLAMPVGIAAISCLGIIADIRSQAED